MIDADTARAATAAALALEDNLAAVEAAIVAAAAKGGRVATAQLYDPEFASRAATITAHFGYRVTALFQSKPGSLSRFRVEW